MRSVVEIGASVPAFLGKLWKLVNDPETNSLISWSPGGKTFVIKNQADFARELLPLYYKHNNMASFIRQLNMYGFHKITSVENGGLRFERDEIEFTHPCFMRGHAYLLEHIKRKIANPKSIVASGEGGEKILLKPEIMNKVLADVKQMKGKQESLDAKFSAMKQENEALWREVAILRQKHIKQQQIVNNLIQFLMSLVQPNRSGNASSNNVGVKRPYQLMINSAAHNSAPEVSAVSRSKNIKLNKESAMESLNEDNLEEGPTIHELAHDDFLHNETSQDVMDPGNYVTIEVSPSPNNIPSGYSPSNPISAIQYHVTITDGDDVEIDNTRVTHPICQNNGLLSPAQGSPNGSSPSPTMMNAQSPLNPANVIDPIINNVLAMSPNTERSGKTKSMTKNSMAGSKTHPDAKSFNTMNPAPDLKLPAEIFDDDSVSDIGVVAEEVPLHDVLQEALLPTDPLISTSKDKMLGGINIKIEKSSEGTKTSKKSKNKQSVVPMNLAEVKTELRDDFDWNDMTLATVNNNAGGYRMQSVNRRDFGNQNREDYSSHFGSVENKADLDDHLDTMQSDLDSLRELLRSDSYSLDPNTLMGNPDASLLPMMPRSISCNYNTSAHLFGGTDDLFYGIPYNPVDERGKNSNNAKKQMGEISIVSSEGHEVEQPSTDDADGNQLISYTGNIPDFEDIELPELEGEAVAEPSMSPIPSSSLNTPQITLNSPFVQH